MSFAITNGASEPLARDAPGGTALAWMRDGFRVALGLDAYLVQKSFERCFADVVDETGNQALDQHQPLARR